MTSNEFALDMRKDEYIKIGDIVERFKEIDELYNHTPWTLDQIFSNLTILNSVEQLNRDKATLEDFIQYANDTFGVKVSVKKSDNPDTVEKLFHQKDKEYIDKDGFLNKLTYMGYMDNKEEAEEIESVADSFTVKLHITEVKKHQSDFSDL